MTDDEIRRYLKPKTPWGAIAGALAVAGALWTASEWLHGRAGSSEVSQLRADSFQIRLDQETMKGDIRAINIRLEAEFKAVNSKLDAASNDPKRRR